MNEIGVEQKGNLLRLRRVFNAPQSTLFKMFTEEKYLEEWWAPEGWRTETLGMSFTEGGSWKYKMVSKEGDSDVVYCMMEYTLIHAPDAFSYKDFYTDERFHPDTDTHSGVTTTEFIETDGVTEVVTTIEFLDDDQLEVNISEGLIEGTEMCYQNLDKVLSQHRH